MTVLWKGWAIFYSGEKKPLPGLYHTKAEAREDQRYWRSLGEKEDIVKVVLVKDAP